MRYTNIKATVLIYTIVLVNISLLMAVVMLNNSSILSSNREVEALDTKITTNLRYKADLNLKYHKTLNSNGSWFTDTISCPDSITLSWSTQITSGTNTTLSYTWSLGSEVFYCVWSHSGNDFRLYFNSAFDDIEVVEYLWEFLLLNQSTTSNTFSDPDGTNIFLDNINYITTPDNIDDNFNSDNYRSSSTWSVIYPNLYWDDDSLARTIIYGYVSPNAGFWNVFWTNTKTNEYISNNTNNDSSIHTKASTASWFIYLDSDKSFDIRVVEFNRNNYNDFNELRVESSFSFSSASWALWYIQPDGSLSWSTWSAYEFDFENKDYAIFLNNTWSGTLFYQVSAVDSLWLTKLYINPIRDDEDGIIRILGNDIFINDEGRYIWKQSEIITSK